MYVYIYIFPNDFFYNKIKKKKKSHTKKIKSCRFNFQYGYIVSLKKCDQWKNYFG